MNTESSIFKSGLIPLLGFMSEIKIDLIVTKSNFLFLLCLKIAIMQLISLPQPSGQRHNFFPSHFASNSMLPACLLGIGLNKQISRTLQRKNATRRFRRFDVACSHMLALLATSLTS